MSARLKLALLRLDAFKAEHMTNMMHAMTCGCADSVQISELQRDSYERRN